VTDVLSHFLNPRNVGDADEPSFTGRAASLICGAHLRISIQIDEMHRVSQARFRAAGCDVLVASASALTERIIGSTTADAAAQAQEPETLFGARPNHEHCPGLACDALLAAVREYSNAARDDWAGDDALICTCFFVSERTIEAEVLRHGLTTVAEVTRVCNAGGGCGSCHQLIQEILATNDLPR
jgi:NifU-like protein